MKSLFRKIADALRRRKAHRQPQQDDHMEALFQRGLTYQEGQGVAQDDVQAAFWWRKAAEQGHITSQANMGSLYLNGRGVIKDETQAISWWQKAAAQGSAEAQSNLATMYAKGLSVTQNDAQAAILWRKAAEQNHVIAQLNLGSLYLDGRGVPKDDDQAIFWWQKAAEQGNKQAKSNLNTLLMLRHGSITEAAEHGYTTAQGILFFSERCPTTGGIEALVLDGTTYFFGFDYRSDLVLSPLFDDIDTMASYASALMQQTDGEHSTDYWRTAANEAIDTSELAPDLKSRTFSSHELALTLQSVQHASQHNTAVPGFAIEYHLLYLLEAAGGWETDMGAIEADIHRLAGEATLAEGETITHVAQRLQMQLKELIHFAPENWNVLFAALSPK